MDRKKDTRDKIQLGGLIVKSGLRDEDKSILLGILLKAASDLNGPGGESLRAIYKMVGDSIFKAKT